MVAEERVLAETVDEFRSDNRRRLQVANALIQQKLHNFLFSKNTLNEVAQATGPSDEEVGTAAELIAEDESDDGEALEAAE
jgi:CRISPR/Cas system-associated endonuclease Cas1